MSTYGVSVLGADLKTLVDTAQAADRAVGAPTSVMIRVRWASRRSKVVSSQVVMASGPENQKGLQAPLTW